MQDALSKILWFSPAYSEYLSASKATDPKGVFVYGFAQNTLDMDSKFIDTTTTRLLIAKSIDEKVIQKIVIGTNELAENGLKHAYGFKRLGKDGEENTVYWGLSIFPTHIHSFIITKPVNVDIDALSLNLYNQESLKGIKDKRGLMMVRLASDMFYLHTDRGFVETGIIKLR